MSAPLLEATDLTKSFGGLVAVDRISFTVPERAIVSIIGPNGAGKTTFFNCMTGLYKPTSGTVRFGGQDITGRRADTVTRAGIARTFQNIKLFKTMTAVENVQVGMHTKLDARVSGMVLRTRFVRAEEHAARDRARALLELVGLRRHDDLAGSLAYGDQRRLEIARALASSPRLLLLDEPTAGMNAHESRELQHLVERLRADEAISILLIEHDMKVVMGLSDSITVLESGRKIAEGEPTTVRADPRVVEAYLGSRR